MRFLRTTIEVFIDTCRRWSEDGGPLLSAGVAYYVALSLFPVLLMLIAGLGFFFGQTDMGQQAETHLIEAVEEQLSPGLGHQIQEVFDEVRGKAIVGGPLGILTLLIAGLAMFAQFDHAFDRIWNIEPNRNRGLWQSLLRSLKTRLKAFLMLLALGAMVVIVFASGMAITTIQQTSASLLPWNDNFGRVLDLGVTLCLNVVAFTLIYRLIPKVEVRWIHSLAGGVFAAVAWEIGRQILAGFVIGQRYESAYGVLGSFLAIMLWTFYAVCVLLFGAEFIQAIRARSDKS